MKTLKKTYKIMNTQNLLRGLPALLFAPALANCTRGEPAEYVVKGPFAEKIVISVNYKDNEIDCPTADVIMDKEGFTVACDKNHYYNHHPNRDELRWGSTSYYDGNHDGLVDVIYTAGVGETFVTHQPKIYDEKRTVLRQDEVHRIWKDRFWKQ